MYAHAWFGNSPPVFPRILHWISGRSLCSIKPSVKGITKLGPAWGDSPRSRALPKLGLHSAIASSVVVILVMPSTTLGFITRSKKNSELLWQKICYVWVIIWRKRFGRMDDKRFCPVHYMFCKFVRIALTETLAYRIWIIWWWNGLDWWHSALVHYLLGNLSHPK